MIIVAPRPRHASGSLADHRHGLTPGVSITHLLLECLAHKSDYIGQFIKSSHPHLNITIAPSTKVGYIFGELTIIVKFVKGQIW